MSKHTIINADCLDAMAAMEPNSVDAIVTDPPYGLSFMGKDWDHGVPGVHFWEEALRVAKPGAHLIAFGGTRTYHRLACAIEDAGWEVRDCLGWLYGSGFPKSHNISKAIDKGSGVNRERQLQFTEWMRSTGITAEQINDATQSNMASHFLTDKSQPRIATAEMFDKLRPYLPEVPEYIERLVAERTGIEWTDYVKREVVGAASVPSGHAFASEKYGRNGNAIEVSITAPATDLAKQWEGWGTALKPAWEPAILARKPLEGTVAANVTEYGTGGLNIDGCRVATDDNRDRMGGGKKGDGGCYGSSGVYDSATNPIGRFPANICHDGSDEVLEVFPQTSSWSTPKDNRGKPHGFAGGRKSTRDDRFESYADSGSAARFFYCAKASKKDRNDGLDGFETSTTDDGRNKPIDNAFQRGKTERRNTHPTVKPTDLMRWLVRLVTPPGGTVLDPFMGSGSTGKAAVLEGFDFIGIDLSPDYCEIAEARIAHAAESRQETLFDLTDRVYTTAPTTERSAHAL